MLQLARMHANEHRVGAGVDSIHDYVPSATARGRLGAQKTPERMLRSYARDSRVRGATVRTLSGEWSSNLDQPLRIAGAGASLNGTGAGRVFGRLVAYNACHRYDGSCPGCTG